MECVGFAAFSALFLTASWLFVRYFHRIQDGTDRRYPESTDDGRLGGGGQGGVGGGSI